MPETEAGKPAPQKRAGQACGRQIVWLKVRSNHVHAMRLFMFSRAGAVADCSSCNAARGLVFASSFLRVLHQAPPLGLKDLELRVPSSKGKTSTFSTWAVEPDPLLRHTLLKRSSAGGNSASVYPRTASKLMGLFVLCQSMTSYMISLDIHGGFVWTRTL